MAFTAFLVLSLALVTTVKSAAAPVGPVALDAKVDKNVAQQRLDAAPAGCDVDSPFTEPNQGFPTTATDKEFCGHLIHFWYEAGYQVVNAYVFGVRSKEHMLGGLLWAFLNARGLVLELKFGGYWDPEEVEVLMMIESKRRLGTCPFVFVNANGKDLDEHIHDKTTHPEWKPKLDKLFGSTPSYMTECVKYQSNNKRKNANKDVLFRGANILGANAPGVGEQWVNPSYTSTTWQPFLTNFIAKNMIVMCGLRGKGMVITDRGEDEILFAPNTLSCTVEQKLTDKVAVRAHPLISALPGRGATDQNMAKIETLWFMNCGQPCSTYFKVDAQNVPTTRKTVAVRAETQIGQGLVLEVPNDAFVPGLVAGVAIAVVGVTGLYACARGRKKNDDTLYVDLSNDV